MKRRCDAVLYLLATFLLFSLSSKPVSGQGWSWSWDQLDLQASEGDSLLGNGLTKAIQLGIEDFPRFVLAINNAPYLVSDSDPTEDIVWSKDSNFFHNIQGFNYNQDSYNITADDSNIVITICDFGDDHFTLRRLRKNPNIQGAIWSQDSLLTIDISNDSIGREEILIDCFDIDDDGDLDWVYMEQYSMILHRIINDGNNWSYLPVYEIYDFGHFDLCYAFYMSHDCWDGSNNKQLLIRYIGIFQGPYSSNSSDCNLLITELENTIPARMNLPHELFDGINEMSVIDVYNDGNIDFIGSTRAGIGRFELVDNLQSSFIQTQLWGTPGKIIACWVDDISGIPSSFMAESAQLIEFQHTEGDAFYEIISVIPMIGNNYQTMLLTLDGIEHKALQVKKIDQESIRYRTYECQLYYYDDEHGWEAEEDFNFVSEYFRYLFGDWTGDGYPEMIEYGSVVDGPRIFDGYVYDFETCTWGFRVGWQYSPGNTLLGMGNLDNCAGIDLIGYNFQYRNLNENGGNSPVWEIVDAFEGIDFPTDDFNLIDWQADGDVDLLFSDGRILVNDSYVSVSEQQNESLPSEFGIQFAYPNPFNSSVRVTFSTGGQLGRLRVYDVLGREVMDAIEVQPGTGDRSLEISLDGMASGVY